MPSIIKELFSRIKSDPRQEHFKAVLAGTFEDQVVHCVSVRGLPHYRTRTEKCVKSVRTVTMPLDQNAYIHHEYEDWLDSTGRRSGHQ
ncbi:MAG: hypothetical protein AAGF11_41000 [Myxococcota bacterium]